MPVPSSLKSLPPAVLAQVNFMITEGGWTIDQIVGYLAEAGHPRSRSAVGRYRKDVDEIAAKLRENREVVDALVREIGPDAVEGKQGRLLVEILRKLSFDVLLKRMDGSSEEDLGTEDIFFLAKAFKEMSAAVRYDQDFIAKAEEKAARKARQEAAQQAETVAKEAGLSAATVEAIKARILGVTLPAKS